MTRRTLEALRNLAERPGTEAEGKLAKEILARLEGKKTPEAEYFDKFRAFLRTGSLDDLAAATGPKTCACGNQHPVFTQCPKEDRHLEIRMQAFFRFPRGKRVFYNCWAYPANCPGTVTGISQEWNWLRIKFDHLATSRAVPIYDSQGWHLSISPIDTETLRQTGLRGGMENCE